MKILITLATVLALTALTSSKVKAETQSSISADAQNPVTTTVATSAGFLTEHPDTDFTASPGVAYFVMKPALTCTLSSAVGAAGKEILVVPAYKPPLWSFRTGIAFKTTNGEHIYSCGYPMEKWMKSTNMRMPYERLLMSDGKNWYLMIHGLYR